MVAHQNINQGIVESVTHVQAASNVGRWDDDAVGFATAIRVSLIDLVVFPKPLPLGFGAKGVVEAGQCGDSCGHWGMLSEDAVT